MEAGGLRKIVAGRAEKNFGISVARPDGLSKAAICRATELPYNHNGAAHAKAKAKTVAPDASVKAALEALAALDINQLSPVEALTRAFFKCVYRPAIGRVPGAVATGSHRTGRYRSRYRTGGYFPVHAIAN